MGGNPSPAIVCDARREGICRSLYNADPERYLSCFLSGSVKNEEDEVVAIRGSNGEPLGSFGQCKALEQSQMQPPVKSDLLLSIIMDPRAEFGRAMRVDRWKTGDISSWESPPDAAAYRRAWARYALDKFGIALSKISAPLFPVAERFRLAIDAKRGTPDEIAAGLQKELAALAKEKGPDAVMQRGVILIVSNPLSKNLPPMLAKTGAKLNPYIQKGMPVSILLGNNAENDDINWVRFQVVEFSPKEVEKIIGTRELDVRVISVNVGKRTVEDILSELRGSVGAQIREAAKGETKRGEKKPGVVIRFEDVPEEWNAYRIIERALKREFEDVAIVSVFREYDDIKMGVIPISSVSASAKAKDGGGMQSVVLNANEYYLILIDEFHAIPGSDYVDEMERALSLDDMILSMSVTDAARQCLEGAIINYCAVNTKRASHLADAHGMAQAGMGIPNAATFAPFSLSHADPSWTSMAAWADDGGEPLPPIKLFAKEYSDLNPLADFYAAKENRNIAKVVPIAVEKNMKDQLFGERLKRMAEIVQGLQGGVTRGREMRFDLTVEQNGGGR